MPEMGWFCRAAARSAHTSMALSRDLSNSADVERLCLVRGLLPLPVGPRTRLNNAAPSVRLHYRALIPTRSHSVPVLRIGTLVLVVCATWMSPLASERQVLTFRTRA